MSILCGSGQRTRRLNAWDKLFEVTNLGLKFATRARIGILSPLYRSEPSRAIPAQLEY